jgi:hypothetical protein
MPGTLCKKGGAHAPPFLHLEFGHFIKALSSMIGQKLCDAFFQSKAFAE